MATWAHLSVLVHRGDPVDQQRYRHTAIYLRFSDKSPAILAHITGPQGEYHFDYEVDYDPSQNPTLAKVVDVGDVRVQTSPMGLVTTFRAIPIDNSDREYNCQTWVERALTALRQRGLLTHEAYRSGIDGMVDAIAEAEDED